MQKRRYGKADWEKDLEFCTIAAFVWQDDYALATNKVDARSINTKSAARVRMKHRYEGFLYMDICEARVEAMQAAIEAIKALARRQIGDQ